MLFVSIATSGIGYEFYMSQCCMAHMCGIKEIDFHGWQ